MKVDEAARQIAITKWALPEGLHVPVAAVDEVAIATYVGEIVQRIAGQVLPRAMLVRVPLAPPRDDKLPIWERPGAALFFQPLQVWVDISYTRYRAAYHRAFPDEDISDKILRHAMNRRTAAAKGYNFVRITPITRPITLAAPIRKSGPSLITTLVIRRGVLGVRAPSFSTPIWLT
jgi:hypothetical protein